jgi:hydrogenase-4 component E
MNFDILAWLSLAIVVCNLYMLSVARLTGMIRGVAAQGFLLSLLPLLLAVPADPVHTIFLVFLGMGIKGILIPKYLFRAIRDVRVVREVEPAVSYSLSAIYGIVTAALAFFILRKIPFPTMVSPIHASIAAFQPLLVEMGVLLDMLVGVFIMVVAVHHIHTKHKSIGIQSLERLTR